MTVPIQESVAGRTPAHFAPVLSVQDLTTSFKIENGWKEVIRNISFDIAPGETVAIVGESGSGKSVTSLSIMRLLAARSSKVEGKVILAGRNLLSLPEEEMRQVRGNEISMIFQEPMTSLNPIIPIGKQIAEALTVHTEISAAEAKGEVLRLLEKVRIPNAKGRYDEYPHQFSGGMRQRVMIAMALASKPKLLIADEPTTALDVTIRVRFLISSRPCRKRKVLRSFSLPTIWVSWRKWRTERSSCFAGMRWKQERLTTSSIGVDIRTRVRCFRLYRALAPWRTGNCHCGSRSSTARLAKNSRSPR